MATSSQLRMFRSDLEGLPPLALPAGLSTRLASPVDAELLGDLLARAFGDETWRGERVLTALLATPDVDATFLVEEGDKMVATCSCQCRDRTRPRGTLHWVGADPARAGRRLGYWACLAALHRFRETGYVSCDLSTDDERLPAIKTYLALGFAPLVGEGQEERWNEVLARIG